MSAKRPATSSLKAGRAKKGKATSSSVASKAASGEAPSKKNKSSKALVTSKNNVRVPLSLLPTTIMIRIRAYLSLHDWASSRQCCIALSLTNDTEVIRRQVSYITFTYISSSSSSSSIPSNCPFRFLCID
jgi:hypothetical protein